MDVISTKAKEMRCHHTKNKGDLLDSLLKFSCSQDKNKLFISLIYKQPVSYLVKTERL